MCFPKSIMIRSQKIKIILCFLNFLHLYCYDLQIFCIGCGHIFQIKANSMIKFIEMFNGIDK